MIQKRIEQLEKRVKLDIPIARDTEPDFLKCSGMLRQYRVGPFRSDYNPRDLVTKIHCDRCGFDTYLWNVIKVTPDNSEPWQKVIELFIYDQHGEYRTYTEQLVMDGYLGLTLFPASQDALEDFSNNLPLHAIHAEQMLLYKTKRELVYDDLWDAMIRKGIAQ